MGVVGTYRSEQEALARFKKDARYIETYDCLRTAKAPSGQISNTVCNQPMWFEYGLKGKTRLTTRTAKSTPQGVVEGVVGTALSPLTVAIDALNFDPSLSSTREHLTKSLSDPEQDFAELNKIAAAVARLTTTRYNAERDLAMLSLGKATEFSREYKNDDFTQIVDSLLDKAITAKSASDVYTTLTSLAHSKVQAERGLAFLRGNNTFAGYAAAFDLTGDVADAKKAQSLASSANDRKKTEYMAIKVIEKKRGRATDLFSLSYARELDVTDISEKRNHPWLFVDEEMTGLATFKSTVKVVADRKAGIFAYGTYDVRVRATLSIPQRHIRRSAWLGNMDKTSTQTLNQEKIVRIGPPSYTANDDIVFSRVELNYKDRGSAGGTTEIFPIGPAKIAVEVLNVSVVD